MKKKELKKLVKMLEEENALLNRELNVFKNQQKSANEIVRQLCGIIKPTIASASDTSELDNVSSSATSISKELLEKKVIKVFYFKGFCNEINMNAYRADKSFDKPGKLVRKTISDPTEQCLVWIDKLMQKDHENHVLDIICTDGIKIDQEKVNRYAHDVFCQTEIRFTYR